jgi:hypothetical protein
MPMFYPVVASPQRAKAVPEVGAMRHMQALRWGRERTFAPDKSALRCDGEICLIYVYSATGADALK